MKIAYVIADYPFKRKGGGGGTYVYNVAHHLKKKNDVFVITKGETNSLKIEDDEGVKIFFYKITNLHYYIHKLPMGRLFSESIKCLENSYVVFKIVRHIYQKYGLDIVEFPEAGGVAILTAIALQAVKTVVVLHNGPTSICEAIVMSKALDFRMRMKKWLEKYAIKKVDSVCSPSKFLAMVLSEKYNIKKNIGVIRNPTNVSLFQQGRPIYSRPGFVIVTFLGYHLEEKGIWVLLDAIPIVLSKANYVHFMYVGGGLNPDNLSKLGFEISRRSLSKSINLVEYCERVDVPDVYASSDVIVVPSLYDNFPTVCLEALSAGKPVIGSNVGGIPEIVDDGVNGLLFKPGDHIMLAERIVFLTQNPLIREDMGRRGRAKALADFDTDKIIAEKVKFYKKLLGEKGESSDLQSMVSSL